MLIYKAINKINGKIYVGQTKESISRRIARHVYENKYYFQKALNKYGIESFEISVIDYAETQELLNEKEKYWIKTHNCMAPNGYNLSLGGEGSSGYRHSIEAIERIRKAGQGRKHSEESIEKMRKPKSIKARNAIAEANRKPEKRKRSSSMLGRHHTEESIRKMRQPFAEERRQKLIGRFSGMSGKHHSAEAKQKISAALEGNQRSKGKEPWNKGLRKMNAAEDAKL